MNMVVQANKKRFLVKKKKEVETVNKVFACEVSEKNDFKNLLGRDVILLHLLLLLPSYCL